MIIQKSRAFLAKLVISTKVLFDIRGVLVDHSYEEVCSSVQYL